MRIHYICIEILMISLGRFGPPKGPRHKPLTPPRDPKRALLGPRAPTPPLLTRTKFRVFVRLSRWVCFWLFLGALQGPKSYSYCGETHVFAGRPGASVFAPQGRKQDFRGSLLAPESYFFGPKTGPEAAEETCKTRFVAFCKS